MAYDPGAIDATLAAAVGDDPGLIADLRIAFAKSAERALMAMTLATDTEDWRCCMAIEKSGGEFRCGAVRCGAVRCG